MNLALYEFIKYRLRPIELALMAISLFRIKRFVHAAHGCSFWIDPISDLGIRLLREGHYEKRTMTTITNYLSEGDVCVDLGANEGYFSVLAAKKVGVTGKVLSIEPQERLWKVWQKNCYLNDITNCQLVPYGISQDMREVEFTLAPMISSGFSSFVEGQSFFGSRQIAKKIRGLYWEKQTAKLRTLDEIWQLYNLNKVKLLKIDIEGFELNALLSAKSILEKKLVQGILVEIHPQQLHQLGQSPQEVKDYLASYGYFQSEIDEELFELKQS